MSGIITFCKLTQFSKASKPILQCHSYPRLEILNASDLPNNLQVILVWFLENSQVEIRSAEPELQNPEIPICEGLPSSAAILSEEDLLGINLLN